MPTLDQRSARDKVVDAMAKQRVLNGIALLEEKHGPDWWRKIDLDNLRLSSPSHCVLGQIYNDVTVDYLDVAALSEAEWGEYGDTIQESTDYFNSCDGYVRGLAILDGDVFDRPDRYGFTMREKWLGDLAELTDAELADEGLTRGMVDDAIAESDAQQFGKSVVISYTVLDEVWTEAISGRR